MKSMSQLAVLTRRWSPATMKLGPFQEVILESSSVEELKEKVRLHHWRSRAHYSLDSLANKRSWQLTAIHSLLFTAQRDERHSSWKPRVRKGLCVAACQTAPSSVIIDVSVTAKLILHLLISTHRAEERFLVTYPCWRFIRTWTGTPKCRLSTCGLCTYATTEPWSFTGETWSCYSLCYLETQSKLSFKLKTQMLTCLFWNKKNRTNIFSLKIRYKKKCPKDASHL